MQVVFCQHIIRNKVDPISKHASYLQPITVHCSYDWLRREVVLIHWVFPLISCVDWWRRCNQALHLQVGFVLLALSIIAKWSFLFNVALAWIVTGFSTEQHMVWLNFLSIDIWKNWLLECVIDMRWQKCTLYAPRRAISCINTFQIWALFLEWVEDGMGFGIFTNSKPTL